MPNIKAAKKKLRQDLKRTRVNSVLKKALKGKVKKQVQKPGAKLLKGALKAIAKAAKKGVVAKNKAARLKSRLTKKAKK